MPTKVLLSERKCKFICNYPNGMTGGQYCHPVVLHHRKDKPFIPYNKTIGQESGSVRTVPDFTVLLVSYPLTFTFTGNLGTQRFSLQTILSLLFHDRYLSLRHSVPSDFKSSKLF